MIQMYHLLRWFRYIFCVVSDWFRSEDDREFMDSFSNMLLKLFATLDKLCTDNDKVRCNAVRAIGNLLAYLPSNCYGKFNARHST